MGLLSQNNPEEDLADELIGQHMFFLKEFLDNQEMKNLGDALISIKSGGHNEASRYMSYVIDRMAYFSSKIATYVAF